MHKPVHTLIAVHLCLVYGDHVLWIYATGSSEGVSYSLRLTVLPEEGCRNDNYINLEYSTVSSSQFCYQCRIIMVLGHIF